MGEATGAKSTCTYTGECADEAVSGVCVAEGQTCVDPDQSKEGDWVCQCVAPMHGENGQMQSAVCFAEGENATNITRNAGSIDGDSDDDDDCILCWLLPLLLLLCCCCLLLAFLLCKRRQNQNEADDEKWNKHFEADTNDAELVKDSPEQQMSEPLLDEEMSNRKDDEI